MYNLNAPKMAICGNRAIGPMTITTVIIGFPEFGLKHQSQAIYGLLLIGVTLGELMDFTAAIGDMMLAFTVALTMVAAMAVSVLVAVCGLEIIFVITPRLLM